MRLFYILAAIAAFLPSSISASHPGRDIQSEAAESQAAIGKVGPVFGEHPLLAGVGDAVRDVGGDRDHGTPLLAQVDAAPGGGKSFRYI